MSYEQALARLREYGQEHLLAFWGELGDTARASLLAQIEQLDLEQIRSLIGSHVLNVPSVQGFNRLDPAPVLPAVAKDAARRTQYDAARRLGEDLIRQGKVAALVVAGGDGSRLGYAGPKGCLPVTPVRNKPLFQVFAEQIIATQQRYLAEVPWYIMASPTNEAATRAFLQEHKFFGLNPVNVYVFTQGLMPAISLEGKIVLADRDRIAWNPDGHGGTLTALRRSGALADMARRGIEAISYFQVDNPLVRCVDPLFVGLHAQAGADMSAKAVLKRDPLEKVGNFCLADGRTTVIEYSDLPDTLAYATNPDGTLRFSAGSIAIHVLRREFVERLTSGGSLRLPCHRAVKKVACVDASGSKVQPEKPNAIKLEMFIFDAMPMAAKTVILQTLRDQEFSPVKNATGADSLATCLHDQVWRGAGWLDAAGVRVPRDADGQVAAAIEISPILALDSADLAARLKTKPTIQVDDSVYLE